MDTQFLKSAPGIKIRDPQTKKYLPEDGALVEMNTYWRRRTAAKDVVVVEQPKDNKRED